MRVRQPRLHNKTHCTQAHLYSRFSRFVPGQWFSTLARFSFPKDPLASVASHENPAGARMVPIVAPAPIWNGIAIPLATIPCPYGNFEKYVPGILRQMLNASPNPSTIQSHLPAGNLDETGGSLRCIKVLAANQIPTGIDNISSGFNWKARAKCPCNS
jgi:hypothetical protein